MRSVLMIGFWAAAALCGCQCGSVKDSGGNGVGSAVSAPSGSAVAAPKVRKPAEVLAGSVIARSIEGDRLFIAEEDRKALRVMPVPKMPEPKKDEPAADVGYTVALPGAPAQVVALDGFLLVTIRDPGLLLVLEQEESPGKFKEKGRVALPYDAWGLSVLPGEKIALVSSAWTHRVSAVDISSLNQLSVRYSVDVAREPRGIAITEDGTKAYINHLVGTKLTLLSGIQGEKPEVKQVELPASPLRASDLPASLGYALTISPDNKRVYAARHALGAPGNMSWFGVPAVDVLLTKDNTPLCPERKASKALYGRQLGPDDTDTLHLLSSPGDWVQPRALVYRKRSKTVLVVSEGYPILAELDAYALDPAALPVETYLMREIDSDPKKGKSCDGASGIALSRDEKVAWVYCRTVPALISVKLGEDGSPGTQRHFVMLEPATSDKELEEGRKFFYIAHDFDISGGLGCAGCHPEGREDGFAWTELSNSAGEKIFFGNIEHQSVMMVDATFRVRQTPMLAGRVKSKGPYGWRAQNNTLQERVMEGFKMHRWFTDWNDNKGVSKGKAKPLGYFVQNGLVAPPRKSIDALTNEEQRGREIFNSEQAGCIRCHSGEEYTDRAAVALGPWAQQPDYEDESKDTFKTPSLFYVGETAPYYHDGSVKTLEELIEKNNDRMGKTNQLSKEDKAALVAFLRAL